MNRYDDVNAVVAQYEQSAYKNGIGFGLNQGVYLSAEYLIKVVDQPKIAVEMIKSNGLDLKDCPFKGLDNDVKKVIQNAFEEGNQ